jgi:hypothetical protein
MAGGKENPLLVHSFVLMAVGAAVVIWGGVSLIGAIKAAPPAAHVESSAPAAHGAAGKAGAAATKVNEASTKISTTQMNVQSVKNLSTAGSQGVGGLATVATGITAAGALAADAGKILAFITPIAMIAAGAAIILAGVFIFKEKNWARYVGFGCLGAALLYFVFLQSGPAGLGDRRNDVVFPIIAMLVVSLLAAKFLWDLWVEKLSGGAAPAAAPAGHGH